MHKAFQILLAQLFVFLTVGCAYHAGYSGRTLPGGYQLVAVPVFRNLTPETGVESYFTNSMIREIERSKVARVADKSTAQATLEGIVEQVIYLTGSQTLSTFNPDDPSACANSGKLECRLPTGTVLTTAYRIQVITRLTFRRNSDGKILWTQVFKNERGYSAPIIGTAGLNSANSPYNHSARYQNIQVLALEQMAEAHDRLMENAW